VIAHRISSAELALVVKGLLLVWMGGDTGTPRRRRLQRWLHRPLRFCRVLGVSKAAVVPMFELPYRHEMARCCFRAQPKEMVLWQPLLSATLRLGLGLGLGLRLRLRLGF
jgi:hypothetical protein